MGKLKEKLPFEVHPFSVGSQLAEIHPASVYPHGLDSSLAVLELIISDIASSDHETASLALRSLAYLLRNEKFGIAISDKIAATIITSICRLIVSGDKKALCRLAVWCLGAQEFRPQVVEAHLEPILHALMHAIDTPLGPKSLTHEALQALVKVARKFSSVRMQSSVWGPAVYRRLLSADRKDREVAEQCMKDLELTLLPPQPSLSKVVAVDINEILLPKMEKMIKSKALVLPTVRAWGWFVRLLGGLAGENRSLVNQLLKIVELTFTNQDTSVRHASLVVWEALIDSLLQLPVIPGPQNNSIQAVVDTVSLSSGEHQKPYLAPPLKRLKLLMVPLISIMNNDKDQAVRLACWHTWSYLAHKLGVEINQLSVANTVVIPIFEAMFKHGPDKGQPSAWDHCLNALEDWICCKVQNNIDSCLSRALSIDLPGKAQSPNTPTYRAPENVAETSLAILWAPWCLDILEVILKLVKVLWNMGVKGLKHASTSNLSLNGALRMFLLVVKGVERDGKGAVKPLKEHIESVHLLLMFASNVSCECIPTTASRELLSAVWSVIESLMDLQPLVLSSSFYKLALASINLKERPGQCRRNFDNGTGQQEIIEFRSCESVTPIVYIIAAWLQFGHTADLTGPDGKFFIKRLESLVVFAISGFNIVGNLHGIARVLDWFLSEFCKQNTAGEADEMLVTHDVSKEGRPQNHTLLFHAWKVFAEHIRSYIESANDVLAVFEGGVGDSGYQVIFTFLLFPLQIYLQLTSLSSGDNYRASLEVNSKESASAVSGCDLEFVLTTWVKLFHCASSISPRMSSQLNSFASGLSLKILKLLETQWQQQNAKEERTADDGSLLAEMLAVVVTNILKQTEVSSLAALAINRKKRLGSFMGVSGMTNGVRGSEADNASNVRDILSLVSRVLDQSCDKCIAGQAFWLDSSARVLEELARFAARLDLQHDVLMFLQDFSKPFAKWLKSTESFLSYQENGSSSTLLVQALQKAWQKHLHSLQKCHPPLAFDSNLLSLQAVALAPAFQHSQTSISNCTVTFWEATYGSKASALNYPPCLAPVLGQLKSKAKISLPGWNRGAAESSRRKSDVSSYTYTGRRWLDVFQEHLAADAKKSSHCMSVFGSKMITLDEEITSQACGQSLPRSTGNLATKSIDTPVSVVPETSERPTGFLMSASTSTEALQAGFVSSQTVASPSSVMLSKIKDVMQEANKESAWLSIQKSMVARACSGTQAATNYSEMTFQGNVTRSPPKCTVVPRRKNRRFLDLKTFAYSTIPVSEEGLFPMSQLEADMVRQGEPEGRRKGLDTSSPPSIKAAQATMSVDELNHSMETGHCAGILDTHSSMSKGSRVRRTSEINKLGIRQQRFLRSSGSLRGGKFWRDASGTVKALQKIRKQAASSPPLILGIGKITTDASKKCTEDAMFAVQKVRKVGRPSLSRPREEQASAEVIKSAVEGAHVEQVPRKRGRPRILRLANSKVASEAMQSTEGVHTVADAQNMGQQMQTSGEQCADLGPNKFENLLKKANTESPFRVQTLNRGLYGKIFSSIVKQSNAINGIASRSHHRKSSCPRRIPVSNGEKQDDDSHESFGVHSHHKVKLGKRSKEVERQLGFGFATPSKILRSGKKLKSKKWEAVSALDTYDNQGAHLGSTLPKTISHENYESFNHSLATASHLENVGAGMGTKFGLLSLGVSGSPLSSDLLQAGNQPSCAGLVLEGPPTSAFRRNSGNPAGQTQSYDPYSSMDTIVSIENKGTLATTSSFNELRTNEELVDLGVKQRLCDVLAGMTLSSEWRAMNWDDLECAQKFLSVLQGLVAESKKRMLNSQAGKV
eukprot:c18246_g1_i2 orf=198-5660(-)